VHEYGPAAGGGGTQVTGAAKVEALAGLRVLVAEDEALIALDVARTLRRAGCEVVGPVQQVQEALRRVRHETLDVAVLDLNLAGEMAFPVADALAARRVPFVFLTGYDATILPERFRDRPLSGKPYSARPLLKALATALDRPQAEALF
jgi:CheY-like chemotaxis protein